MLEQWGKRTRTECERLYQEVTRPILAEWFDRDGREVTLYDDGVVEATSGCPVELLPLVCHEWHLHLEGKIA